MNDKMFRHFVIMVTLFVNATQNVCEVWPGGQRPPGPIVKATGHAPVSGLDLMFYDEGFRAQGSGARAIRAPSPLRDSGVNYHKVSPKGLGLLGARG